MHGCPKCFNSTSYNPLKCQTMGHLFKICQERSRFIRNIVKKFVEIGECEIIEREFRSERILCKN
jgi:hypothetical protein